MTEERLGKLERRVEELEETLEVVSDRKLLRSIQGGLRDLKEGRYARFKDVDSLFADIEHTH